MSDVTPGLETNSHPATPANVRKPGRRVGPLFYRSSLIVIGLWVLAATIAWPYMWQAWAKNQNERMRDGIAESKHQYYYKLISLLPPPATDARFKVRYEGFRQSGFSHARGDRVAYDNITFMHMLELIPPDPSTSNRPEGPYLFAINIKLKYNDAAHAWEPQPLTIRDVHKASGHATLETLPDESLKNYYRAFLENYDVATTQAMATQPLPQPASLHNEFAPRGWQRLWHFLWYHLSDTIDRVRFRWRHM